MEQHTVTPPNVDREVLREAIQAEYRVVANDPDKGFHFHTGRPLTKIIGYKDEWLDGIPETAIESFAGTGNPFSVGKIEQGENVVDIGCGGGIDSLIAAKMVGPTGKVKGFDMTPEMLERAQNAANEGGFNNVEFKVAYAEDLPVEDGWADVIISNGVFNLAPDKPALYKEMFRILKPGGRLQIGDIMVSEAVPEEAKDDIELWTG